AANAFSDPDGTLLAYAATRDDGSPLPSWITFNGATRTFAGTPPHTFTGTIDIKITASDGALSASDTLLVVVTALNHPPINGTPSPDSLVGQGGDTIHGLAGNDTISGTGNTNTAFGDDGNDLLYFQGDQNQLFGSEGNDWLGVNGNNNAL